MSKGSDDWYDLPRAAAGIRLYQIRDELREKNLHDTEEPPLESSTAPPAGEAYNVRTSDGTYNDLKCPAHGQRRHALRAQRALERGVPRHREPSDAQPATGQPRAPDPHRLSARDDPQRDRCGVDPVHGPRLVRAQERQLDAHPRHPAGRGRQLARADDARAEDAGGSAEGRRLDTAAGLHQREHALVGRFARLRQQPVGPGVAACRPRGQGAGQPERAARRGSGHRPRDHRVHRERLGGAEPAARAVRARAQRHLRQAEEAQSALGRRAAVPAGAPGQRGAAREDSHRGVVVRHPSEGRPHHRPEDELARTVQQAAERLSEASPTTTSSRGFPGRRPITTACRFR